MSGYKTYIGIIVALTPTVANMLGYSVSPSFDGQFTDLASAIVQIAGLAFAAYGRAVAQSPGWFAKK